MKSKLVLLFLFIYCPLTYGNDFGFECVSSDLKGKLVLRMTSSKVFTRYTSAEASKDAIKATLYNGFTQSQNCSSKEPLLNSNEHRTAFKNIEKVFFKNDGDWKLFIQLQDLNPAKDRRYKSLRSDFTIEVTIFESQLKRYLIENSILDKLSNGF
jgi:hypothetical protein